MHAIAYEHTSQVTGSRPAFRRCMMALNRALSEPLLRFFAKG